MGKEFCVIKNMEAVKKGLVGLTFLPYQQYNGYGGVKITVEIAACGHSGSMLCFTAADADDDIVNTSFQFVPGLYPLLDNVTHQTHLYDETEVEAKGLHQLLEDGDIEYPDLNKLEESLPEKEESSEPVLGKEEVSDNNVQKMFAGTGVNLLDDDDDDTTDGDDEDDDDTESFESLDIEDEIKEGTPNIPSQDLSELGDDDDEEERSRSMDEIKEILERKKKNRQNISYVGVKDSSLPTENGPMRPQDFDARMAENANNTTPSDILADIRRVEQQRERDNEMKARYEKERRSKYERKKDFKSKNRDNRANSNKRHIQTQSNKQKLDMNDLDNIIGSIYPSTDKD